MLSLEARVASVDRANQYANQVYDILTKIFAPFVGQKIRKKDGTLLEKVKDAFGDFEFVTGNYLSARMLDNKHSLGYLIQAGTMADDGKMYWHECPVYIGHTNEAILTDIDPTFVKYKTDYNYRNIQKLRETFWEKEKEYLKARENLYPFGENDR